MIVKVWLQNVVAKELVSGLVYNPNVQSIWDYLNEMFSKVDGTRIFQLHRDLYHFTQGMLMITIYIGKMKVLWDELAVLDDIIVTCDENNTLFDAHKEKHKLIQFLLGLNETNIYVSSDLCMKQPLPTLSMTYFVLLQDKKQ